MPDNSVRTAEPPNSLTEGHMVRELLRRSQEPTIFIIFGASGDLTRRKLVPALYNLCCSNLLPEEFSIVGFAVTPMDDDSFREAMKEAVKESREANPYDDKVFTRFASRFRYITADFTSADGYKALGGIISELEQAANRCLNRLFYLATPPSFYADIVARLGENKLVTCCCGPNDAWTRVIVEKPFGYDLKSAEELNTAIHKVFDENEVYRIDHYLGKETVQNILAFRFANSIIEPIWNRRYVDHIQITAAETLGVEHRGAYYEGAGCLRDMFQNHLLQLMSIVAMDPPMKYSGSSVRDRKADVLRSILPINPENLGGTAVRGQYAPGTVEERGVPGYRQEDGVRADSNTETFVALKLFVDSWRWADVPFYLRSGKRMARKVTEILVQFKRVPHLFFHLGPEDQIEPNYIVMRIQPDEGIALRFGAKVPGPEMHIRQVQMNFSYTEAFQVQPATAYETLLLDAMLGDPTLFNRSDAVETSWSVLEPLIDIWHATKPFQPFPNYASGTWGPATADQMLAKDGRSWHNVAETNGSAQTYAQLEQYGEPVSAERSHGPESADGPDRPA
jgi:glucose-6-phosphate 1-dehydrogenase